MLLLGDPVLHVFPVRRKERREEEKKRTNCQPAER
jgi:hypothetical protein